ncbi:MAG: PAS domain-containing protein, partial [Bacteroidota bacterium]
MEVKEDYLKKELYDLICKDSSVFDFLQNSALDGFWYWNLENPHSCWADPKFWRTLGYNIEYEFAGGRNWQNHISPESLIDIEESVQQHLKSSNTSPYDQILNYLHKDGQ